MYNSCGKHNGNIESFPSYWAKENLKLREEPLTDSKEILTIQQREMVQILDTGEEETINNITGNWVYVQTENGEKGWCFGGYLTDNREEAFIISNWRIEEEWGISGRIFESNGVFNSYSHDGVGGFIEFGSWSINENNIHIIYDLISGGGEYVTPFNFIDDNTLKIGDIVYHRVTE